MMGRKMKTKGMKAGGKVKTKGMKNRGKVVKYKNGGKVGMTSTT